MRISTVFLCLGITAASATAAAAPDTGDPNRVLSPYFVVLGDDDAAGLPLAETRADIHIAGVIAHVRVTQVYQNAGSTPIEAIYVFPGSTRAAVFGMRMTIGDRTIVAQINEREQARQLYEAARAEGKSASLLEQQRPNVFQMSVANIMPGDEIKVELDYTELLVPEDGFYELVYPAVVGPRYSDAKAGSVAPSEQWIENPHLHKGEPDPYRWDVTASISAGLPIQKIASPSHQITPTFQGEANASITLGGNATFVTHGADNPGNRDFVLRYRLAGGQISSGLLLYPGAKEKFFLLMMQPPERVETAQMPPREYVFIVDVSGSMHGFPIAVAKEVMNQLLDDLRPQDRFNVMLFSGGSTVLSNRSMAASRRNIRRAMDVMDSQRGGGSTRLLPALQQALNMPSEGMSRTFVVVTDGYVSVEDETFEVIRNNLGNANLFAFGIGSSVNRHLIEGMARVGLGESFVALDATQARATAQKFREYISAPVLTNVGVEFTGGFEAYDVEPPHLPDVFASRPVLVFGKYHGTPVGRIEVTGITGAGDFRDVVKVGEYTENPDAEALRYLWARHRIGTIADLNQARMSQEDIDEVTRLGLEYSLMTKYTSFVAIDSLVRNTTGDSVTVNQPVPMPAGVEDTAIGVPAATHELSVNAPTVQEEQRAPRRASRFHLRMPRLRHRESEKDTRGGDEDFGDAGGSAEHWTFADDEDGDVADDPFGDTGTESGEEVVVEAKLDADGKISTDVAHATIFGIAVSAGNERRIRRVLERNLPQISACGDDAVAAGTLVDGARLTIQIKLDAKGRVVSVKMTHNGLGEIGTEISECVITGLKNVSFREVAGRKTTITVHYEYRTRRRQ